MPIPAPRSRRLAPLLAVAVALLAAGCSATPTPAPASSTAAPGGALVFGTSTGYPPFSYYDDQGHLTGFDVALAQALAAQMGTTATIKDMVFDSLPDALALDQIDAAIAAISITPERQARADFSDVYYLGEDAVLARPGGTTAPRTVAELAPLKLGVERGTVYQT